MCKKIDVISTNMLNELSVCVCIMGLKNKEGEYSGEIIIPGKIMTILHKIIKDKDISTIIKIRAIKAMFFQWKHTIVKVDIEKEQEKVDRCWE